MLDVVIGRAAPLRVENNAIVIRVPSHVLLLRNAMPMNATSSGYSHHLLVNVDPATHKIMSDTMSKSKTRSPLAG